MINTEKLQDAVFGLAIGDALGVPYEFKARGSYMDSTVHSRKDAWRSCKEKK